VRNGFTIIETVIAICLISILTAIATPGFARVIDAIEVRAAAMEVETSFSAARHLAIARGAQAFVEIDPVLSTVSVRIGTDTVRKRELAQHHVDIQTTRASMSYSAIGVGYGAANLTVVIRRNAAVDSVVVSRLGRVRR
jgi:prepilin-type N-terminal cleavage/methylation domain-containing protein